MKVTRFTQALSALIVWVSLTSTAIAQSSSHTITLGDLGCQSLGNIVGYRPINTDIPINRQVFTAVSYLDGQPPGFLTGRQGVMPRYPAGVSCRLAASNETPRYRTLTLAFGFADNSSRLDHIGLGRTTALRLTVYTDGNVYGSETVRPGDMIRWPIDVTNIRSIALEAECLQPGEPVTGGSIDPGCPVLYFFQDTLR